MGCRSWWTCAQGEIWVKKYLIDQYPGDFEGPFLEKAEEAGNKRKKGKYE